MADNNILALDIGEKRVGVALARADVRIPVILDTLDRQAGDFWQQLAEVVRGNDVGLLVLGLPRGLEGQDTAQTAYARNFASELAVHVPLQVVWQDEALTSVKAEDILGAGGKPYQKSDVDGLAASFILTDYLESNGGYI